jgi:hypothetical protein
VNYAYVVERSAAELVFRQPARERRFLQTAFSQIAAAPFQPADLEEPGNDSRRLLTRFFGPFSITYWLDDAVKEVRIVAVYRD